MIRARCLCGAVAIQAAGQILSTQTCHCRECRAMSGHVWASAEVAAPGVTISGPLRWFRASLRARRGFCPVCGAFLIWQADAGGTLEIALGALAGDAPAPGLHEHLAEKGDYYPWAPQ
jgi:hypothetical protein